MILDTNALSAAADNDAAAIAVLADTDQLALPVIVLAEYKYGISQSRHRADYENWLRKLVEDCLILEVNERTTHHYADINLELRRMGRSIPTNDLWIAALSRQHSMPILSRDCHFDLVSGSKRIDW